MWRFRCVATAPRLFACLVPDRFTRVGLASIIAAMGVCFTAGAAAGQTAVACGQVVDGSIDTPLEQDQFTFFGEAGDIVTFTFVQRAAIDPAFVAFAHTFNPDGSGPGVLVRGITNWTLRQTGVHRVRIFDLNNTRRGTYSLRLAWLLPLNKQCGDRTALTCDQTVDGTISAPLELDNFTFFGQQGTTVTFTFVQGAAIDPAFVAFAHTFNPDGSGPGVLVRGITNWTLRQTGVHTVRVFDLNHTRRGGYSIRLSALGSCPGQPPPGAQAPNPPTNLAASVVGANVTLSWTVDAGGSPATSFVIDVGSAPGLSNLVTFDTRTASASFAAVAPSGTYFVRVRARNGSGTSGPSNEVVVLVGAAPAPCVSPPPAPANLLGAVAGQQVTIQWAAPGGLVTTFVVEAGSVAGASNIANFATGSTGTSLTAVAAPGMYFVRVRARNNCGTSGASNEIAVSVF